MEDQVREHRQQFGVLGSGQGDVISRGVVVDTWSVVYELHPGAHALSDEHHRRRGCQRRVVRLEQPGRSRS